MDANNVVGASGDLRDQITGALPGWLARHDPAGTAALAAPVLGRPPLPRRCLLIVTDQRLLVASDQLLDDHDTAPLVSVPAGYPLKLQPHRDGRGLTIGSEAGTVDVETDPAHRDAIIRAAARLPDAETPGDAAWPAEPTSDMPAPLQMPPGAVSAIERLEGLDGLPGTTLRTYGCLGGSFPFEPGDSVAMLPTDDGLALSNPSRATTVPWSDVIALDVGGPGKTVSGGGFFGGGYELEGAIIGMATAAGLNRLTRRQDITTLVAVTTTNGELHLLTAELEPLPLHVELSAARDRIRRRRPSTGSVAAELAQLSQLHQAGHLTDDEYRQAKAAVLQSPA